MSDALGVGVLIAVGGGIIMIVVACWVILAGRNDRNKHP